MPKRSCDFCVRRKVKCDNGRPCSKCIESNPPLQCTYLKPVLKRGPKTSKLTHADDERCKLGGSAEDVSTFMHSQAPASLSPSIFTLVIEVYQARVYPVWPVLDAQVLLERLRAENDRDAYILTVALCCATMAQLNIAPIVHQGHEISSSWLERECCRMRAFSDFRSNPSIDGVLTSFFLHVYHAKADNRNAAMMYLQEGIALARLLRLDDCISPSATVSDNEKVHQDAIRNQIIYVLLWVSERGYALQFGLPVSIQDTLVVPFIPSCDLDTHAEGLLELARLFASFDGFFKHTRLFAAAWNSEFAAQVPHILITTHESLAKNGPRPSGYDPVQRADFEVTKHWMRTLLWQEFKSQGLLFEPSTFDFMSLSFPSQIAHDLLAFFATTSTHELLPLGRDQLSKSLEITNTLADVISAAKTTIRPPQTYPKPSKNLGCRTGLRLNINLQERESCRCGPADFLHGLFQAISPLLESDQKLKTALREKAAAALLDAAGSIVPRGCRDVPVELNIPLEQEDELVGWKMAAESQTIDLSTFYVDNEFHCFLGDAGHQSGVDDTAMLWCLSDQPPENYSI